MIATVRIPGLGADSIGPDVFADLARIHPDGVWTNPRTGVSWFKVELPASDPRVGRLLDRLTRAGFRPWEDRSRTCEPNEFWMSIDREYDAADADGARYLHPKPRVYCEAITRDSAGQLEVDVEKLKADAHIAGNAGSLTVLVSSTVKRALEPLALRGVVFRPTVLVDATLLAELVILPWDDVSEPFWELTGDRTLPPLSPSCRLIDNHGRPVTGDNPDGCFLRDGLYSDPEFRYQADALARIEPFDAALTREHFGIRPQPDDRSLVVSARFYQACRPLGLDVNWIPVRLDAD